MKYNTMFVIGIRWESRVFGWRTTYKKTIKYSNIWTTTTNK